jgi:hypothetical protein
MATLVGRNANESLVAPIVGSGGVCFWWESGFISREHVFTFNLVFKEFYKCNLNTTCKEIAAIICITVLYKMGFFPVNFDGSYVRLVC